MVVYGTGFSRECYVYSGKLILFSKFCFEIKNNIFKQPNVYVLDKIGNFYTVLYLGFTIRFEF